MAQFDVHRDPHGGADQPYLLDVQSDLLQRLPTRVVVPLVRQGARASETLPVLTPVFDIQGELFQMVTYELAAIRRRDLGQIVAQVRDRRVEIVAALDLLLTGA